MSLRARVNPFFEAGDTTPLAAPEVRRFHRTLPEYTVTPLHRLSALARSLGIAGLELKDESARFGLGAFKGLGASWALQQIRARHPGAMTVAAATEGNHGRAVAWAARRLGLPAVIFIPGHAAPARIARLREEGARVEIVDGSYDEAVRRCAEWSRAEGWQVVSDTGYAGYLEIPGWISEGYRTLFEEAEEQRSAGDDPPLSVVLVQAGVGSLLQAAVMHYRSRPNPPILVAVEPVSAAALFASVDSPYGTPTPAPGRQDSIMAGLNCGEVSLTAWPVVRRGVELFITVGDDVAEAALRRLARPRGADPPVVAGPTGAAGLAGLLALREAPAFAAARRFLKLDSASRVLVVNTEGAIDPIGYDRVMSTDP